VCEDVLAQRTHMSSPSEQNEIRRIAFGLAKLLKQVAASPHKDEILELAGSTFFHESELEERLDGYAVEVVSELAIQVAAAGEADMDEQSRFYKQESQFVHSDLEPDDCVEYSEQYADASKAYATCRRAILNASVKLINKLKKINF
jgi:hypothetical protein